MPGPLRPLLVLLLAAALAAGAAAVPSTSAPTSGPTAAPTSAPTAAPKTSAPTPVPVTPVPPLPPTQRGYVLFAELDRPFVLGAFEVRVWALLGAQVPMSVLEHGARNVTFEFGGPRADWAAETMHTLPAAKLRTAFIERLTIAALPSLTPTLVPRPPLPEGRGTVFTADLVAPVGWAKFLLRLEVYFSEPLRTWHYEAAPSRVLFELFGPKARRHSEALAALHDGALRTELGIAALSWREVKRRTATEVPETPTKTASVSAPATESEAATATVDVSPSVAVSRSATGTESDIATRTATLEATPTDAATETFTDVATLSEEPTRTVPLPTPAPLAPGWVQIIFTALLTIPYRRPDFATMMQSYFQNPALNVTSAPVYPKGADRRLPTHEVRFHFSGPGSRAATEQLYYLPAEVLLQELLIRRWISVDVVPPPPPPADGGGKLKYVLIALAFVAVGVAVCVVLGLQRRKLQRCLGRGGADDDDDYTGGAAGSYDVDRYGDADAYRALNK